MRRYFPATVHYIVLTICAFAVMYPVLYAIATSLMSMGEASMYPPHVIPHHFNLRNFIDVFDLVPIATFIGNTFLVSIVVMLGQLITSSMAAYAFARMNFKGKNLLFAAFMATMMIPWEVTIIPNYLTIRGWDWLDSYQGLIVPFLAASFGTFLLRQFFMQLPTELFEAARMDGCGHVRIFFSHVLPLSRPAIGTLAVYSFLQMWNAYLWPLLITNSDRMRTVQIGVSMLQHQETTQWNLVFAGIVLVILPSLLMLALGLKQLVRGMTVGALKG
ncbi:carbohydrate ABC transporter membrane protein 2 (CUT1 family) [Paenibacillus cellulosilyticus]|uniref:Carbohydrate ABC transporter membrane protein 2 (CUT1 family) n=1 Tax=Paenibacillus cellulosilyticus TaxID=375489 RepID=A0A2V2YNV5_9BACL|nr:carbohydrate ABC transporter permease [Paenibacillus cellulosilyticus]PWV97407.1 carbohydrate ABC transporter membrane protein 2 (CUT1 family) [Paenibacillus cellulosilyticus]QKS48552.1 carbohydrate ABC transporter permease [Paenibacillus cellulosilyticus]